MAPFPQPLSVRAGDHQTTVGTAPCLPSPHYLCVRHTESDASPPEMKGCGFDASPCSTTAKMTPCRAITLRFSPEGMQPTCSTASLCHARAAHCQQDKRWMENKTVPDFPLFPSSAVPGEPHVPGRNPARGWFAGMIEDLSFFGGGVAWGGFSPCLEPAQTPDGISHPTDTMPPTPWRCPGGSWLLKIGFLRLRGNKILLPPELFIWQKATSGGILFQLELPKFLGLALSQDQALEIP